MTTQKSQGRKPKGKETRKAVTFRLQPSTIERIKDLAAGMEISQSDVIERLVSDCY
jgi:predicted transcriptional regulator